jgi:hypothetical protein
MLIFALLQMTQQTSAVASRLIDLNFKQQPLNLALI